MGKSLKGKELGVGISQKQDGTYVGRITDRYGDRKSKTFEKLQECRKWITDMQYEKEHGGILIVNSSKVEPCFVYWLNKIKKPELKGSTYIRYDGVWRNHICPIIGDIVLTDVKPIHCLDVLQSMSEKGYMQSTIKRVRTIMKSFFLFCVENKLISDDPMTRNVKAVGEKSKEIRVLTIQEQRDFLEKTKNQSNYNACAFILQTGLRYGELTALSWDDVDWKNGTISITKSATYKNKDGWIFSEPKTKSSYRTIYLTEEAVRILREQEEKCKKAKIKDIRYRNLVFPNKNGKPNTNNNYNIFLKMYCEKEHVQRFSLHSLRHTFATRCIEANLRPKTLQKIMGHATLSMTMDLYVHVTDQSKKEEMKMIENMLKVV